MESDQKIEVSAVFQGAIHMDRKRMSEHMFCPLIMYISLHHMR